MPASVMGETSWHQTALTGHAAVLVIDSDAESLRYIQRSLAASGWAVTGVRDLDSARTILAEKRHDIVLLSLDPRCTGWPTLVRACREASAAPLFALAENSDAAAVAEVLEQDVDDCLATPFNESDLHIRIRRLLHLGCLRRGVTPPRGPGGLRFDLVRSRVCQGRREIRLTSLEYRTLWVLAEGNGAALTFRAIEARVWGDDGRCHRLSLRRLVRRLRQKLSIGTPETVRLQTEPRVGYRLRAADPHELAGKDARDGEGPQAASEVRTFDVAPQSGSLSISEPGPVSG